MNLMRSNKTHQHGFLRYQQKESQRESLRSGAFSPRQATQRKPLVAYAETANAFLGAIDDLIHARPAGKLKVGSPFEM